MECRNLHSLLNESLERPLSEYLQSQVDAHLAGCPACQTDATLLRSMIQAIEEAPEVRPSDDFTLKVMDRLPIPLGGFLGVQTMTLRIVAAATAVMAAGLGWVYQGTLIHNLRQLPVIVAPGTDTLSPYMDRITTSLYGSWATITGYLPLGDIDRFSPMVSVLIAVGVAHVILKMVYGFETADSEELAN